MESKHISTCYTIFRASFLTFILLLACQTINTAGFAPSSGFSLLQLPSPPSSLPPASLPMLHAPPLLPVPLPPSSPARSSPLPGGTEDTRATLPYQLTSQLYLPRAGAPVPGYPPPNPPRPSPLPPSPSGHLGGEAGHGPLLYRRLGIPPGGGEAGHGPLLHRRLGVPPGGDEAGHGPLLYTDLYRRLGIPPGGGEAGHGPLL